MGIPIVKLSAVSFGFLVSIQLISPASGNFNNLVVDAIAILTFFLGFHSINIPSEWEYDHGWTMDGQSYQDGFHSINIPSEWE